ncbi:MAG: glycerol-3-phosphate 1-O-acyltransferase PlsY [Kiritimatiellae bacterium]|nr:glycerol-3-phosphate 1-O-acyltransferase PlsY [Kiritimatiellia bacterium]
MSHVFLWLSGGLAAYLLGSVPFGFLIAKACGKDIRALGSGNIGATNVFRSVSKPLGVLTFALDFLKGFCGVRFVPVLAASCAGADGTGMGLAVFCGAMTVAGHNWTCFLGFKGGKGVATSAGLLLGLSPAGVGIAFAAWLVLFLTTRYVSVASIGAALTLAAVVWPLHLRTHGVWFPTVLTFLAAVAIWKHRTNIARLRAGTESRFSFGKKGRPQGDALTGRPL